MTVKNGTLQRVCKLFGDILWLDTESNNILFFFFLAIFSGHLLSVRLSLKWHKCFNYPTLENCLSGAHGNWHFLGGHNLDGVPFKLIFLRKRGRGHCGVTLPVTVRSVTFVIEDTCQIIKELADPKVCV